MSSAIILKPALQWSGSLQRKVQGHPQFAQWLGHASGQAVTATRIEQWLHELQAQHAEGHKPALSQILRELRSRVFYCLMCRDLAGSASLEEVTLAMSSLADLALQYAYQDTSEQLAAIHGQPTTPGTDQAQEMLILGMGKLGGRELNVSSDIDLIMLYEHDGETTGRRPISYHEFYGRLTQRMMPVLSELNAYGQVFRTDLRLRPDGESGPLAWSMAALEKYLLKQGREWERYAWIKARPIPIKAYDNSDNTRVLQYFESLRTPFVYRKYFDFDALAALRELRERIRQDWQRKALHRNGTEARANIKLGDGGIREIEFVVQLNQLIRGGRQPSLQAENLLVALQRQENAGVLDSQVSNDLRQAYYFLRQLEHRLQYREDEQTHMLPQDPALRVKLAHSMGMEPTQFEQQLSEHRARVAEIFKDAFRLAGMGEETSAPPSQPTPEVKHIDPDLAQQLDELTQGLLQTHKIRSLPSTSHERLKRLLPLLREQACQSPEPINTARRLLNLVDSVAQRSAYLALMAEFPETLARVTRIVSASSWAAQYLCQYPILLDSLIEWHALMEDPDFDGLAEQMRQELDACVLPDGKPDVEQQMNWMRDLQHQVTFQLLAQDLEGKLTVETLADQLSALADMLLNETLYRTWPLTLARDEIETLAVPNFAVLAYGKLGGKEIGYASDLDLVFLYDDPEQHHAERYIKLARRMTSWLSTLTSSGRLYEIDLRLRPDGDAGLLAVSIDAFEHYQTNKAWAWEHQAISRARVVCGPEYMRQRFESLRAKILLLPRDSQQLRDDICSMRAKITQGHPNRSDLFDIKHDKGGMVDVEFITQYLVLNYSRKHPSLLGNLGNIALLGIAAQAQLIPTDLAHETAQAYRLFRREQHALRLEGAEKARIDPKRLMSERVSVQKLWDRVFTPST